ncbi:PIN domain nuclease [Paramagnetospirillum kuznetsovii]|uniref:Ribonuclease VapC n=1 Tax=Paramagnetospirillum kuznetsovii TaxID=2053833 RepID=A0A364NXB0_9PROT|nr:type II toxin-antitoxin system VapC family toxin [Paramagnetospirillum kuznetsovii]RAU21702.1 PIN domain nuclease [Paramagnetospirillum kuznetsovii]
MSAFIIDASVAIKWIIEEEGSQAALALRKHSLAAPDLLMAECANILWKKARRGELSADEVRLAASLLMRADMELMPMRPFLEPASAIAIALDHSAYDCIYLAMAEAEQRIFVTADERLLRKIHQDRTKRFVSLAVSLAEADARLN